LVEPLFHDDMNQITGADLASAVLFNKTFLFPFPRVTPKPKLSDSYYSLGEQALNRSD